ncbi:helix-turn-helix domain-containing protein [Solirubrobacter ginsenosidimutans]|uniref:Helix-turn-helix domain-containing protein n=1 Tax=Solirubrobacter ginsenosidimutans TaxID=490573 RepID=A0A9X3MUD2_9ACTN|nr:helix-turn-helix domain-containing protein [Solirubrobacter ginsenosidimutans]MDA0159893.1 helix-turn-helix domain-containing protein [Solirubrobacter ginsenosidimutans]
MVVQTETASGTATPPAVRELAAELLPQSAEIARAMNDHLFAMMPELRERDDGELRLETLASCEVNIAQVLRLQKLGAGPQQLVLPVEAAEWARSLVRRGITLATLLRAYRLGHAWLWDRWSQQLYERVPDSEECIAAEQHSSAFMFAYIDLISDVLVAEYGSERERVMRSAEQLRAETVRAILAGEPLDGEVASRRLGYELRRHHVALRVSGRGSELRGLERAAREAAAAVGAGDPLVVATGAATVDVWSGALRPPGPLTGLDAYVPPDGILVAVGTPGQGIDGFRRSHVEALQAGRVAALARGAAAAVTRYERVELVALLASDFPRARAFVGTRLGSLAAPDESAGRLRETVLAFLVAGGSATRVAKLLFVHQNTVAYRVKRAEELLGRRVTDDPIELTCALTLAAVLGSSVLAEDDEGEPPAGE